jgi:hypothetical protein
MRLSEAFLPRRHRNSLEFDESVDVDVGQQFIVSKVLDEVFLLIRMETLLLEHHLEISGRNCFLTLVWLESEELIDSHVLTLNELQECHAGSRSHITILKPSELVLLESLGFKFTALFQGSSHVIQLKSFGKLSYRHTPRYIID